MVDNIETIANALLQLMTNATEGVVNWGQPPSRNPQHWANVDPASQPCMYVVHPGGTFRPPVGYGTQKGVHHFNLLVYMRADADIQGTTPETLLNAVWVAMVNGMMTNIATGTMLLPGQRQTLGLSFVENAWLEGDWFYDNGALDQQMALVLPVKVSVGIIAGNK